MMTDEVGGREAERLAERARAEQAGIPWRSLLRRTQHRTSAPTNELAAAMRRRLVQSYLGEEPPTIDAVTLAALRLANASPETRAAHAAEVRRIEGASWRWEPGGSRGIWRPEDDE